MIYRSNDGFSSPKPFIIHAVFSYDYDSPLDSSMVCLFSHGEQVDEVVAILTMDRWYPSMISEMHLSFDPRAGAWCDVMLCCVHCRSSSTLLVESFLLRPSAFILPFQTARMKYITLSQPFNCFSMPSACNVTCMPAVDISFNTVCLLLKQTWILHHVYHQFRFVIHTQQ